jgi:hypothetical protein
VENQVSRQPRWRRLRHVPVAVRERDDIVRGEGLDKGRPELSARAGD